VLCASSFAPAGRKGGGRREKERGSPVLGVIGEKERKGKGGPAGNISPVHFTERKKGDGDGVVSPV